MTDDYQPDFWQQPPKQSVAILDLPEGLRRKERILAYMAERHAGWIDVARRVARSFAKRNGTVTADDVREYLYAVDVRPNHHNAWGAVFKGSEWEWTGGYHRSAAPSRHGNMQRIWRLKR